MHDDFPSNLGCTSPCSIAYNIDIFAPFPPKFQYVVAETMGYTGYDIYFSFKCQHHCEKFD